MIYEISSLYPKAYPSLFCGGQAALAQWQYINKHMA